MSFRGGKKRHSSQPLESVAKDVRKETTEDSGPKWSTVVANGRGRGRKTAVNNFTTNRYGLLSEASSYPDKSMRSASISSSTGRGRGRGGGPSTTTSHANRSENLSFRQNTQAGSSSQNTDEQAGLGSDTRFVTPEPEGSFRDDFGIEFRTINGRPFKGTITFTEAKYKIFMGILGFESGLLYSVRNQFSEVPILRFKLKQQVNLDDLRSVEYFDLERQGGNGRIDVIACRIMGIGRGMQSVPHYDGAGSDTRWVKIEGCEYSLEQELILDWLKHYGEPISPISEDIHIDTEDSEGERVGNGIFSVKMKLHKDIPQFLPMHSKKIRIYYRNMTKLCTNCFGKHTRRQCRGEKVPWVVYVRDFMDSNVDIEESMYGKWWGIVDNEFPGYFETGPTATREEEPTHEHQQQQYTSHRDNAVHNNTGSNGNPAEKKRNSRDPRLNRGTSPNRGTNQNQINLSGSENQTDHELAILMSKGLTLQDAQSYLLKKREMESIEQRMFSSVQQHQNPSTHQAVRGSALSDLNDK